MNRYPSLVLLMLVGSVALTLSSCARDSQIVKWESKLAAVELSELRGQSSLALAGYRTLEGESPTPVDGDLMRLAQARVMNRAGQTQDSVYLYEKIARTARRRSDRARARYEIVDIIDEAGFADTAKTNYRRLVLTYPDLMPGSNALLRLQDDARSTGGEVLSQHLDWTAKHYGQLAHTSVADNMLFFAAREAVKSFSSGNVGAESVARTLYQAVIEKHPTGNLADDAMWDISYLDELTGDLETTIATIRGIQRQRQTTAMIGNNEHRFYWLGELRIARLLSEFLERPREAIQSYELFVRDYPDSRWRDDALYWLGCLWLRVGQSDRAEESFEEIRRKHPESRYIRRFEAAITAPSEGSCIPREFKASW